MLVHWTVDPALRTTLFMDFGVRRSSVLFAQHLAHPYPRFDGPPLPAGSIISETSEQLVRLEGRIKDPSAFGRIIVATRGSAAYLGQAGVPIYLDQVAQVVDGVKEMRTLARLDCQEAVALDIQQQQGGNTVAMVENVDATVKPFHGIAAPSTIDGRR